MKIRVSSLDTHKLIKELTYEELLNICNRNEETTQDFLSYIRKKPNNTTLKERWEVID